MHISNWKLEKSIVFSKANVEQEGDICYLPWYMVMFVKQEKMPEKMIYEVDLSAL